MRQKPRKITTGLLKIGTNKAIKVWAIEEDIFKSPPVNQLPDLVILGDTVNIFYTTNCPNIQNARLDINGKTYTNFSARPAN